jgi:glycosyltransferase involved in cell wall biosynthesis
MNRTFWLAERIYPSPTCWLALPAAMQFVLKARTDLSDFDPQSEDGRLALYFWWERHGRWDYPDLDWRLTAKEMWAINEMDSRKLFEQFPQAVTLWLRYVWTSQLDLPSLKDGIAVADPCFLGMEIELPRFLTFILSQRPDLRRHFNTNSISGIMGLLRWWSTAGKREYERIVWSPEEILQNLANATKDKITPSVLALPTLAKIVWTERKDLQTAFSLNTLPGCLGYSHWWAEEGRPLYPEIASSLPSAAELLAEPSEIVGLPNFLVRLTRERPDLSVAFELDNVAGRIAVMNWWENHGRREYPELGHVSLRDSESGSQQTIRKRETHCLEPLGVNVVGFPQGVLGIGEDARMAAQCLHAVSIPFVLVEAPHPGPTRLIELPATQLSNYLRFCTTVFCLPPFEMMRLALEGGKSFIDDPSYKIGAWAWELPHWPVAFDQAYQFVDEIWAQSRFVETAFSRHSNVPVHLMPMAVDIPRPTSDMREKLSLPLNDFLFYVLFDAHSWLRRKNPMAAVDAFKKAFAPSTRGVGLVVKAMNIKADDPIWLEIQKVAASDSRIHVIDTVMSRQETINFMNSCDAYISLHRSEGFGRVIAESMLLGKPVVVTNFSGNVDYCDTSTAYLVDGELVPLKAGDYLITEGQYWCEPDIDVAARQLQDLVQDAAKSFRIALEGQRIIASRYSVEAVAHQYHHRIDSITRQGVQ